jgi:hypothetical protein
MEDDMSRLHGPRIVVMRRDFDPNPTWVWICKGEGCPPRQPARDRDDALAAAHLHNRTRHAGGFRIELLAAPLLRLIELDEVRPTPPAEG